MIIIPGIVISVLTFPGVIVHELAHVLFCKLFQIPIFEVKYFQFQNPTGYVVHERTQRPLAVFAVSIGPFIVNTLMGIFILLPCVLDIQLYRVPSTSVGLILAWLGISILMHAFPSTTDAKNVVTYVMKNKNVNLIYKILTAPVLAVAYIGSFGSLFWLDLVYAIAVFFAVSALVGAIF